MDSGPGERGGAVMPRLEVRLFGTLRVTVDGRPVTDLGSRRARDLLAYLCLERRRPHSREKLAGLFWPEADEGAAYASLRQALWLLRKTLAAAAGMTPETAPWIAAREREIGLAREGEIWIDVAEFEARLAAAPPDLEGAVELYEGDLLEGCYEDWCAEDRERLRELQLRALGDLVARREAARDLAGAIAAARHLIRVDPLREDVHARLIGLLAANNERGAALRQYQGLTELLGRELGVEPDPSTQRLAAAIRDGRLPGGAPASPPAAPPGGAPVTRPGAPGAVFEAPARPAVPTRPPPERLEPKPGLVDRAEAWQAASEAILAAARGAGLRAVAFVGEPGIGKTRLADELLDAAAEAGLLTAEARCYQIEDDVPFQPWADLLRALFATAGPVVDSVLAAAPPWRAGTLAHLLPELGTPAPATGTPELERSRLFEATAWLVGDVCAARPLVLALDDLQWADDGSLALLHYVLRRSPGARLAVVLGIRPATVGRDALEPLAAGGVPLTTVALGPLPADETAVLARSLGVTDPALLTRIAAESGGNPFFVTELSRAAPAGVHPGEPLAVTPALRRLVTDRLAGLGPDVRRVAELAAVMGRTFDLATLERGTDLDERRVLEALGQLLAAGIAVESGIEDRYDFSHETYRETLEAGLHAAERRRVHARIAEVLGASLATEPERVAGPLARHLRAAGEARRAARVALIAAELARRLASNEEAARHYEFALEVLAAEPPTAEIALAWCALGDVYRLLSRFDDGRRAVEHGLALFRQMGDDTGYLETTFRLTVANVAARDEEAAAAIARAGLAYAERIGAEPRLRSTAKLAIALSIVHDPANHDEARRLVAEAEPEMPVEGHDIVRAARAMTLGLVALSDGGWDEARERFEETATLLVATDWTDLGAIPLLEAGCAAAAAGEDEIAARFLARACGSATHATWRLAEAWISLVRAALADRRGRDDEATALLDHAVAVAAAIDDPLIPSAAELVRGRLALQRGAHVEAIACFERALAAPAALAASVGCDVARLGLAEARLGAGELEATGRLLADFGPLHDPALLAARRLLEGRLAQARGELEQARAAYREAAELATGTEPRWSHRLGDFWVSLRFIWRAADVRRAAFLALAASEHGPARRDALAAAAVGRRS